LAAIAERAFYNDFAAFAEWTQDLIFDPEAFTDALDATVVTPLRQTQALFDDGDTLTRLFTTLSAEEMTRDPVFDFNPDLPQVSNLRSAAARWDCEVDDPESVALEELVLVVTLRDGREVRSRPFADGGGPRTRPLDTPAASVIEQMSTVGAPQLVRRLTAVAATVAGGLPAAFGLDAAYPNPFNAAVVVPFLVPEESLETRGLALRVYNLLGQPVAQPWSREPNRLAAIWLAGMAATPPVPWCRVGSIWCGWKQPGWYCRASSCISGSVEAPVTDPCVAPQAGWHGSSRADHS